MRYSTDIYPLFIVVNVFRIESLLGGDSDFLVVLVVQVVLLVQMID